MEKGPEKDWGRKRMRFGKKRILFWKKSAKADKASWQDRKLQLNKNASPDPDVLKKVFFLNKLRTDFPGVRVSPLF